MFNSNDASAQKQGLPKEESKYFAVDSARGGLLLIGYMQKLITN
jgi:hypothetical protein